MIAQPFVASPLGEDMMKTVQTMLAEADAEVPRISPDEAKGLLGRADVLFLDVREPAEVATSGKVPVAVTATVSSSLMKPRRGCFIVVSIDTTMPGSNGRRASGSS